MFGRCLFLYACRWHCLQHLCSVMFPKHNASYRSLVLLSYFILCPSIEGQSFCHMAGFGARYEHFFNVRAPEIPTTRIELLLSPILTSWFWLWASICRRTVSVISVGISVRYLDSLGIEGQ